MDKNLTFFKDKPLRGFTDWYCNPSCDEENPYYDDSCQGVPANFFPDLKWESDPIEVELTFKKV